MNEKVVTLIVDIVAISALIVYCFILLLYVFNLEFAVTIVKAWPAYAFDLPMSGIASFAIVSLLREIGGSKDGSLSFKAFSLEFNGPAGPATLWVVVFLSIVVSFKLLK
jgi:hypothetical protein